MQFDISFFINQIEPTPVLVFGIFLMFGVFGGIMASHYKWMPTITAFMLFGLVGGPHGIGLISHELLKESSVLIDIALGLILYKLGNMLHPKAMMRSTKLMITSVAETVLSFLFVFALMWVLGGDMELNNLIVLSAFVGAIAVSSSPAVLVHVSEEMDAKGPVTERAKSLVALNNLFSFLIFCFALPFGMISPDNPARDVFLLSSYQFFGAVAVGIAVAWLASRVVRVLHKRDEHYRFAIVIGAVSMTLGISEMVHTSALFAPLILGIAVRSFETSKHNLSRIPLGEGGDLFYIVLFVMAGAKIDPAAVWATGIIPVLLVIMRCCGKFAGVFLVSKYTGFDKLRSTSVGLLLVPMAGMAIGLAATTSHMVPQMGVQVTTIIFAMVAIFETIGPFAAAHAFRLCGEANEDEESLTPRSTVQAPKMMSVKAVKKSINVGGAEPKPLPDAKNNT